MNDKGHCDLYQRVTTRKGYEFLENFNSGLHPVIHRLRDYKTKTSTCLIQSFTNLVGWR